MVVHAVGGTDSEVLNFLRCQGVAVDAIEPFDERPPPHCNKISGAIRLAERGVEGFAVLTDTDIAVLEDPRRLEVPLGFDRIADRWGPQSPSANSRERVRGRRARDQRPRASRLGAGRIDGLRSWQRGTLHHSRRNALDSGAFLGSVGEVVDGPRCDSRGFPQAHRPAFHGPHSERLGDYSLQARHTLRISLPTIPRVFRRTRTSCGSPLPPKRRSWGSLEPDRHCGRRRADRLREWGDHAGLARSFSERIDFGWSRLTSIPKMNPALITEVSRSRTSAHSARPLCNLCDDGQVAFK